MSDPSAYAAYCDRARKLLGQPVAPGAYAKWNGRLVKILSAEEFSDRLETYQRLRETYDSTLRNGDTVNDAVVQLLEDHATELLLKV